MPRQQQRDSNLPTQWDQQFRTKIFCSVQNRFYGNPIFKFSTWLFSIPKMIADRRGGLGGSAHDPTPGRPRSSHALLKVLASGNPVSNIYVINNMCFPYFDFFSTLFSKYATYSLNLTIVRLQPFVTPKIITAKDDSRLF